MRNRNALLILLILLLQWQWLTVAAVADTLTLPCERRPEWLSRDGIVMAISNEPLFFRVRRDGSESYTPTPEQLEAYRSEHSPEMVAQLKKLGVNFVMMHCYKGAGLKTETQSMQDAVEFAKLCHDAGMRIGTYTYSCAFIWELFFKEVPQARQWLLLDAKGNPLSYGTQKFRYRWNRNHPDAQEYYKKVIRFAVQKVKTDLVHIDNYSAGGQAYDDCSVKLFHKYLSETFSPERLKEMGIEEISSVRPPVRGLRDTLLGRAWQDFRCQAAADSYYTMSRYARTLRKDVLMELNPHGVGPWIIPHRDHGRMLTGGEAFWDEGARSGMRDGKVQSIIRTYKVARRMNNICFRSSVNPLEMAEAMAFNQDCLGCVCTFEYGNIRSYYLPPHNRPLDEDKKRFIRFFHNRRDLLRGTDVIADVAILRNFPSQVFASPENAGLTYDVEQALIENRICFQIIYDRHLDELDRYKALALAGCVALSDRQAERIKRFVKRGGRLCIIGPAGTHDEWMLPREKPALAGLPENRIVRINPQDDWLAAIRRACNGNLSLQTSGPVGLCAELTSQNNRRMVHLVNFRDDGPIENLSVNLRLPSGSRVISVLLASPEHNNDIKIDFQQDADSAVNFIVPKVGVYEIAVVVTTPVIN